MSSYAAGCYVSLLVQCSGSDAAGDENVGKNEDEAEEEEEEEDKDSGGGASAAASDASRGKTVVEVTALLLVMPLGKTNLAMPLGKTEIMASEPDS